MKRLESNTLLKRRGAWLIGPGTSWQMYAVHGPLPIAAIGSHGDPGRQYFRIETASREVLWVSRAPGERGMRELRLDGVAPNAAPEPRIA